jgi:hypothetical protein
MNRKSWLWMLAGMMAVVALVGVAAIYGPGTLGAATGQTGQGIMVNLKGAGTFAVVDQKEYKFNELNAAAYFTNTYSGVVEVSGSPLNRCLSTSAPTDPYGVPAVDPLQVYNPNNENANTAVKNNKCTFLDGGTLSGSTYTQTHTYETGSGSSKCTWKYTYYYNVAPTQTVAPLTAWDLVRETNGAAEVSVDVFIAGESVVKSSNPKVGTKYSFSLVDSSGNRIENLQLTITDSAGNPVNAFVDINGTFIGSTVYPGSTVVTNTPGSTPYDPSTGALDFTYTTNAGSNGNTSLLQNGDARTILNTDSFAGNNDGGADGSALAAANMDTQMLQLGAGDYKITLTGTVKGNNALADLAFSVTGTVHIISPGCGQ